MRLVANYFFYVMVVTLCISLSATSSYAVTPAEEQQAIREQNRILQLQDKAFDAWETQHEQEQQGPGFDIEGIAPDLPTIKEGGPCFAVDSIHIEDSTLLSTKTKHALVEPYLGTCMYIADIQRLVKSITAYYVDKGYITSRVTIPKQDLRSGMLRLRVLEGRLEGIELNDNSPQDTRQLQAAFPHIKAGQLLNIYDLEQGMDQFGRLSSNKTSMELLPGSQQGGSILKLTNKVDYKTKLVLGYDNAGQESTGEYRAKATLHHDNLLNINDFWSLNIAQNPDADDGELNRSVGLYVSVPYGYWTFSANATYSEYESTINGTVSDFITSGDTSMLSFDANRLIYRSSTQKLSLLGRLALKESENYIEDIKLDTSSRSLTVFSLGADHQLQSTNYRMNSRIMAHQGIDLFGAREDAPGLTSTTPHAQFQKLTADVSYCRPLTTLFGMPFNYCGNARGQYSFDPLYSQEKLSIGDQYSVRGFKDNSIAGDSGAYLRNEISFQLPPLSKANWYQTYIGSIRPFIAYDTGFIRDIGGKEANGGLGKGYLSGWSVGVNMRSTYFNANLTYSEPLNSPEFLREHDEELYGSIGVTFRF